MLYKDLLNVISNYDSNQKLFEVFTKHGMPEFVNKDALISIYSRYDPENITHFYEFSRVKKEDRKGNPSDYDIPMYTFKAEKNFSIFSTIEEKKKIENYIRLHGEPQTNLLQEFESVSKTPEPRKEHSFCQLCHTNYTDYKDHINSSKHKDNIEKHRSTFERIKRSCFRIRNKQNKKKEIPNKNIEDNEQNAFGMDIDGEKGADNYFFTQHYKKSRGQFHTSQTVIHLLSNFSEEKKKNSSSQGSHGGESVTTTYNSQALSMNSFQNYNTNKVARVDINKLSKKIVSGKRKTRELKNSLYIFGFKNCSSSPEAFRNINKKPLYAC